MKTKSSEDIIINTIVMEVYKAFREDAKITFLNKLFRRNKK